MRRSVVFVVLVSLLALAGVEPAVASSSEDPDEVFEQLVEEADLGEEVWTPDPEAFDGEGDDEGAPPEAPWDPERFDPEKIAEGAEAPSGVGAFGAAVAGVAVALQKADARVVPAGYGGVFSPFGIGDDGGFRVWCRNW